MTGPFGRRSAPADERLAEAGERDHHGEEVGQLSLIRRSRCALADATLIGVARRGRGSGTGRSPAAARGACPDNAVYVTATNGAGAPVSGANVSANCGDGVRQFGKTGADGKLEVRVPHVTCDFQVGNAKASGVAVAGDLQLPLMATSTSGDAGGSVSATLALTLGTPGTFGAFTPGVARTYEATTRANVTSTAGDALLSVADPSSTATGHLVNGAFWLPEFLQARARNAANSATAYSNVGSSASPLNLLTYSGPASNDTVDLQFSQWVKATDALRTGTYAKTLTFTLSTTNP